MANDVDYDVQDVAQDNYPERVSTSARLQREPNGVRNGKDGASNLRQVDRALPDGKDHAIAIESCQADGTRSYRQKKADCEVFRVSILGFLEWTS